MSRAVDWDSVYNYITKVKVISRVPTMPCLHQDDNHTNILLQFELFYG